MTVTAPQTETCHCEYCGQAYRLSPRWRLCPVVTCRRCGKLFKVEPIPQAAVKTGASRFGQWLAALLASLGRQI